jgi:hypothetical protein
MRACSRAFVCMWVGVGAGLRILAPAERGCVRVCVCVCVCARARALVLERGLLCEIGVCLPVPVCLRIRSADDDRKGLSGGLETVIALAL